METGPHLCIFLRLPKIVNSLYVNPISISSVCVYISVMGSSSAVGIASTNDFKKGKVSE